MTWLERRHLPLPEQELPRWLFVVALAAMVACLMLLAVCGVTAIVAGALAVAG
jgi:hypothetical protein